MFLNRYIHTDYDKDILPYLHNGILIDTCVLKEIIDGIVETRVSKRSSPTLLKITLFLDSIFMGNRWDKFIITPHILTEVCTHLRNDHSKKYNQAAYQNIVNEVLPILKSMRELQINKDTILNTIDFSNPIVEIGDLSIYVATEEYISKSGRMAILSNDAELNNRYKDNNKVMILDYQSAIANAL